MDEITIETNVESNDPKGNAVLLAVTGLKVVTVITMAVMAAISTRKEFNDTIGKMAKTKFEKIEAHIPKS
jgi:hypothetical protein